MRIVITNKGGETVHAYSGREDADGSVSMALAASIADGASATVESASGDIAILGKLLDLDGILDKLLDLDGVGTPSDPNEFDQPTREPDPTAGEQPAESAQ